MSGHSKWSQIKRQKGVADIKRGKIFTKMANAIIVAIRDGKSGDPDANFKLRLAIEQARSVNMPKENIQRAIERGLGKSGVSGDLDEVIYEGFGPGKVAIIIEALTDNRNRTTSEIKKIFELSGGTLTSPGSISWMFADGGVIVVPKNGKRIEEIFDLAVEAGAEDVEDAGNSVEIYTKPQELEIVKKAMIAKGLNPSSAQITKKPSSMVEVNGQDTAKKILNLMEKLEEQDDVQKVYSNFDISDSLLEEIQ